MRCPWPCSVRACKRVAVQRRWAARAARAARPRRVRRRCGARATPATGTSSPLRRGPSRAPSPRAMWSWKPRCAKNDRRRTTSYSTTLPGTGRKPPFKRSTPVISRTLLLRSKTNVDTMTN
ncbi:uncharacterized protein LOC113238624 [Hyposmocoma kahamanoa]|uniref:uncharacterized protein LOC113238624 n=1 Tax=Hyposmocoma kahamanoa TaxID=1477025 RepID=UPI000E6D9229|nr:uncharacterized protein LOC113238624 [Hyposmocoma kahamanoa]